MPYYVVRDTDHPQEDLERNFSCFLGGSENGEENGQTEDEAREKYASHLGVELSDIEDKEFAYHPAHEAFCVIGYHGLGAFELEAETLKEALTEANNYEDNLAVCTGSGSGHFFASKCISFHKVREGRYIFLIK